MDDILPETSSGVFDSFDFYVAVFNSEYFWIKFWMLMVGLNSGYESFCYERDFSKDSNLWL